ncbi:MAG: transketolase-like TK C-terminal-containing protein [Gammaproteobacteria bacterium]
MRGSLQASLIRWRNPKAGWSPTLGGAGAVIGVERFGASAPGKENLRHYGFTVENVVGKAMELMDGDR